MIFILVHPTKRAMSSPLHTIRISLKMIKLIKFTTLAHSKQTLLPTANHCWTYSRPRNHTESTVCFKDTLAETYTKSQLYKIHFITQKCLTLLSAAGKPPVQTHCTTNYTPVIQKHSSNFNTIERFTQKSTNKSNSTQQIRNVRGNRYRVLKLRSDQWCRNVQSLSKL